MSGKSIVLALLGALLVAQALADISVSTGSAQDSYVLTGRLVTPEQTADSKLIVQGDQIICVGNACAEPANATRLTVTDAYVLPGFIDAHNHVAYNVFPKWKPPKLYQSRYNWQSSTSYKTFKAPYNALKSSLFCEMVKYGEIKALISGVTTIQGTAPNNSCFRTLIRNAENQNQLGLPSGRVRTSILDVRSFDGPVDWDRTKAFVVHLAEGVDQRSRDELGIAKQKGLLHEGLAVIHGTAFEDAEFQALANVNGRLIWSPQSNLLLYGKTTNIKAALAHGIKVSLGVDWNPTGSDTIFDELRVADTVNREQFAGAIPASDWVRMITVNPAEALSLGDQIGQLVAGHKADLTIVARLDADVNRSLLKSHLEDVELVAVGGRMLYGKQGTMDKLRPGECEALSVHETAMKVCVKDPVSGVAKSNQTLADIRTALFSHYAGLAPLVP